MWSLAVLLTVLFVGLKLTGYIAWSWIAVISPIPITLVIIFAIVAAGIYLETKDESL